MLTRLIERLADMVTESKPACRYMAFLLIFMLLCGLLLIVLCLVNIFC